MKPLHHPGGPQFNPLDGEQDGEILYRTIDASFWTDPKVGNLSIEAKLTLLYLITNPHSHVGGIYYLRLSYMVVDLGLSQKAAKQAIDDLSKAGFVRYDAAKSVVWIVNMFKYQGRGEKNDRAVANQLETLHGTGLITEFLSRYPIVGEYYKPDTLCDTLSDTLSDFGTPIRNRSGTETEQEKEQEARALHGEFRSVKLSEVEYEKLRGRLNGNLENFIDQLDRYSQTSPAKFRKYKSHYAVILDWFDRAAKEGRIPQAKPSEEEIERERAIMFPKKVRS